MRSDWKPDYIRTKVCFHKDSLRRIGIVVRILTGQFSVRCVVPENVALSIAERRALRIILRVIQRLLPSFERRLSASEPQSGIRLVKDVLKVGPDSGHETVLRICFTCNQRCGFCFVDLSGKTASLDEIERSLDFMDPRARSAEVLTISGGEPTTHPRLLEIVELSRRRGFRKIKLQTNAVHLSRRDRVEKLGTMMFFVSFHSHRPELYDQLTRSRGQFRSAVSGIRNILEAGGNQLTINIVVNSLNYAELPGHIDFIDQLRHPHPIAIFFSMLSEVGLVRTPDLGVDLGQMAPALNESLERCRKYGIRVEPFSGNCAIPLCQLRVPGAYRGRAEYPQDDVRYQDDFIGCDKRGRAKRLSCKSCLHDQYCRGVCVSYAQRFGLDTLRPIRPTRTAPS